jgi:hypothetical protein
VKSNQRQWRVDLDEDLVQSFTDALDRLGMTQKEGTKRLMQFYLRLDPDVQALVMQQLTPQRSAMLAKLILRQIGKGPK